MHNVAADHSGYTGEHPSRGGVIAPLCVKPLRNPQQRVPAFVQSPRSETIDNVSSVC